MFSNQRARGSTDNLSIARSIPSTPPATYLYNSQPSTPLPAAISGVTAQGLNWSAVTRPESTSFPWTGIPSWTPTSPPAGQDDMFDIPESSSYTHSNAQSSTATSTPKSPTISTARRSRKNSSSSRNTSRKSLKLHLPPLNQEALVQAALSSNLITRSRSADDINADSPVHKLRNGMPANIAKSLERSKAAQHLSRAASDPVDVSGGVVDSDVNPTKSGESHSGLTGVMSMLTPPDEDRDMTWQGSGAISECGGPSKIDAVVQDDARRSSRLLDTQTTMTTTMSTITATSTNVQMVDTQMEVLRATSTVEYDVNRGLSRTDYWLNDALICLLSSSDPTFYNNSEAIRIVSHALPCPLPSSPSSSGPPSSEARSSHELPTSASAAPQLAAMNGYFMTPVTPLKIEHDKTIQNGTTTALHAVTTAIQRVFGEEDKVVYMHVSHAVSSTIPLSRLPSGPLTGSGMQNAASGTSGALYQTMFGGYNAPQTGDGYFPSVFHSIVIARDLTEITLPPAGVSPHPSTILPMPMPSPVLPPFSLHYSLLERYIPPPTPSADIAMFNANSSPLLDRIFELSAYGGSLLFVYPTKTGAKEFCSHYLDKVLDPLLRRLMVLYRLRDDLLWGISKMTAVDKMQEFDGLEKRIQSFCKRLSERPSKDSKKSNAGKLVIPVSVVYAEKITVKLNQVSWREWWTQQEQGRIKEVVKHHFSKSVETASTGSSSNAASPTVAREVISTAALATIPQYNGPNDLAREILDGVKASTTRPSSRGMGEAVAASSMVGAPGGSTWNVIGEGKGCGGIEEGVEVGVFVLRRFG